MPKASKDLATFEKRLRSLANIKAAVKPIQTAQLDKAALATQRLQQQQQRLAIQATELANRQERARQATERLTQAQTRLNQVQERAARVATRPQLGAQQDAHIRAFRAIETERLRIQRQTDAESRRQQQAAASLQRQRSTALIRQFNEQERAARRAADIRAREAKKAADAEIREARRSASVVQRAQDQFISRIQSMGPRIQAFGRSLSVALTVPLAALGAISVKSARDIDDQANTLKAFTGSAEAAEKRLAELIATAQRTPGLTTSLGLMLDSQLRVAEVTVETIDKILPAIGKLNAVSRLQDPQRFAQNMVQLITQNFERIDLKELVGQSPLAGQIIKELFNVDSPINAEAIRESAKKMGLTTTDAFFAAFAEAAGRNQALATITESISSRFGKAVDRVMIALRPLGLAIVDAITPAINALIPFVEKLSKAFADLPKPAQQALLVIGGLAALLGPALVVVGSVVTSLGGLIAGIAAVAGVIGSIGFPALLAVLAGVVIVLTRWAAIAFTVFKAWQTNFLGIRGLVANAANAVLNAFNRIRAVFEEATRRILPTLQSITSKVLNAVTAVWERYGKTVVKIVGDAFEFIVDVTETFARVFTDFIDLVLKLIDGDWRGAWRAFARIIITQLDNIGPLMVRFERGVRRALLSLIAFIVRQAFAFADAASRLATTFIIALAAGLITGAPKISNALALMLVAAIAGVAIGPIAQVLVARLIAEMRRAAGEALPSLPPIVGETSTPGSRQDVAGAGIFSKKAPPPAPDAKGERAIANQLAKLREAQDKLDEQREENRLREIESALEQQFALTKDGLDREQQALEDSFEDRLKTVKTYFAERSRLETAQIDAELAKEKGLSNLLADEFFARRKIIQKEFETAKADIEGDKRLKGRARDLALQTAELNRQTEEAKAFAEFESQNAQVATQIRKLHEDRNEVIGRTTRSMGLLTQEIEKQRVSLSADLLEERGDITGAASMRLSQQFKETLKELRVDVSTLSPELQAALDDIDLSVLKTKLDQLPEPVRILLQLLDIGFARARISERVVDVDRSLAELRLQEAEIQNKVLDGVLSERDARAAILGLQEITRGRLLDILAAQLAIARSTEGQEDEVLRIRAQIQEIERLGIVIDDVGKQINQELFSNIEQGFEGFFQNARRGFEGLKDAAISFGESLLNTLNKLAAQSITAKFEGIFTPDAASKKGTEGTPGGFLAKLFGLGPKPADTAAATALTTAGTTAGTALTTGATAAGTALATGGATVSATLVGGITAAAASFAAAVTAAGAAFAAAVAAGAGSQALGGLGGALGAAKGDFLSPRAGGRLIVAAEGGYPEAVLTADPKHAARQFRILRAYLAETKGLFGRIPRFAEGGFISARQTEMDLLSLITRGPSPITAMPAAALANAGGGSTEVRLRQILTTEDLVGEYLNSPEGERVFVDKLSRNAPLIRRLTQRRT